MFNGFGNMKKFIFLPSNEGINKCVKKYTQY